MSEKLIKTAFHRLVDKFKEAKQPFDISTRPYYSSGGFTFVVEWQSVDVGGITRLFVVAPAGQKINFFSYGIGDSVAAAGMGGRSATDIDTNIIERANTNNEDMCIEGISATSRGSALIYSAINAVQGATTPPTADWVANLTTGIYTVDDVAGVVMPPEVGSPLTLEDQLFRAIGPKTMLRLEWNRKEGDYIGTLDEMPEGGGKSYLKANGEPTAFNYFRVPEGWIWRREGAPRDTILNVSATLLEPVYAVVSFPAAFPATPVTGQTVTLGNLTNIQLVWKLRLHGRAAYLPSENV